MTSALKKGSTKIYRITLSGAILILFSLLLLPPLNSKTNAPNTEDNFRDALEKQAQELLEQMTLRQKVAQLFIIRASGDFMADDNRRFLNLKRLVEEHQAGGIIFFGGQLYNQAVLTNRLQELSPIPLWIAQDMEYGAAMRITDATRITPAMGIAATGNPQWAFEKGRITALEAKAVGVHQIYAPVVDVNNNPANPVINVRSFSEDPEVVSNYALAFIRGVQSQGLVATAKHFPGHGDTNTDSHLALPVITHSLDRMRQTELIPFKRVIEAGVGSIMTAHIAFPNIGTNPRLPATLDSYFMTDLLQKELGFDGLIVTDALEMAGIANHFSPGDAAIRAVNAGADMILLSPDEMTAILQMERAVLRGELSEERINQSVLKILRWKIDYGLFARPFTDIYKISERVGTRHTQMIADEIARQSITLLRNRNNIVPIRPDRFPRVMVIAISNHRGGGTGAELLTAMNRYHPNITLFNYDSRTSQVELDEAINQARQASLVIIGSYLHLATGQRLSFDRPQQQFINRVMGLNKPTALVSFSSPYIVSEVPNADVHLLGWSMAGSQSEAVASALFGASDIDARLPITIPGMYARDSGISIPRSIIRRDTPETVGMSTVAMLEVDRIMNQAIADSIFPGGVVAVVRNGVLAWHEAYGYHTYDKRTNVSLNSIFDLASLTKPLATGIATMMLVEEGKISLNDRVSKWFPEYNSGDKSEVTIEHLLRHTSGLPPFRTYVDVHKTRSAILNAIKNEPLVNKPGTTTTYSDLGYILLAEIIAYVSGVEFDQYLARNVFGPMRLSDTGFKPSTRGNRVVNRTLPTETDNTFRNKTLRAEVHDERAYFMGGVAGHAGLFSTGRDLAVLMDMIMRGGNYAGRHFFHPSTLELFSRRDAAYTRALGFDLKSLNGFTTAGSLSSENTFGHLGFTGTSFWIDPERNLAVVILTNRTYPERGASTGINRTRASVMDAVIQAITDEL